MILKKTSLCLAPFLLLGAVSCSSPPSLETRQIPEPEIQAKILEDSLRNLWSASWELVAEENWEDAYSQACSLANSPDIEAMIGSNPELAELHWQNYHFIVAQCLPYLDLQGMENAGEVLEYDFARQFTNLDTTTMDNATKSLLSLIDTSGYDIPITVNHLVLNCIRYFQTTARIPFSLWLSRMQAYSPSVDTMLKKLGAPSTLRYLPLIESGYNPKAYSRARASGLWQFIAATGRRYGLQYDYWIDERRNPERSTLAGISYLKDLYQEFGDWKLSLAAYNCGENKIRSQMRKKGHQDYWTFDLPRQTKLYVPLFFAASIIGRNPAAFGFSVPPPPSFPEMDTVQIQNCLDLHVVAEFAGCDFQTVKQMNLELRQWCTPPGGKRPFTLRLPRGSRERFVANLAKTPPEKFIQWHRHQIRPGENLSAIARAYGLSSAHLREANNLSSNHISSGKYLLIPLPHNSLFSRSLPDEPQAEDQKYKPPALVRSAPERVPAGKNKITYIIRDGDNLWDIANRFGLAMEDLLAWNGLRRRQTIFAGQHLALYLEGSAPARSGPLATAAAPAPKPELAAPAPEKKIAGNELQVYVVRPGDTLWDIARRYGTTVEKIVVLNNIKYNRIQRGNRLLIPDKRS